LVAAKDSEVLFEKQLAELDDALGPWAQDEMIPNLLGARQGTASEELRAIYGPVRYDRLAAIKQRYDPNNHFCINHNIAHIAPAGSPD
jgi:hypothetical protein